VGGLRGYALWLTNSVSGPANVERSPIGVTDIELKASAPMAGYSTSWGPVIWPHGYHDLVRLWEIGEQR
jgi:hypothetical protein